MSRQSIAYKQAFKDYNKQIWRQKHFSIPGILLPGIGSTFVFYVPPIIISRVIERFNGSVFTLSDVLPYVIWFGVVWLTGEMFWRIAILCLNRADSRGMQNLYQYALEQLLAKDQSFFQNNFAGSLTKKLLGYGRNFESYVDTLSMNVLANIIPLCFVLVVLWAKSPYLTIALFVFLVLLSAIIIPLTIKRKKLTDTREIASNTMAGHVADVISNMHTVQAFSNEKKEQEQHELLVNDYMKKSLKSWDFHAIYIDMSISPAYVAINVLGLIIAIVTGQNSAQIASIFLVFSYYGQATRVFWEFNRIYRNIENALSDAGQFTELLLDTPAIHDPVNPFDMKPATGEINFNDITFSYKDGKKHTVLFDKFDLHIKSGEHVALVGPSGGGKSTITKLLLRFVDVHEGSIDIDGIKIKDIARNTLRSNISYVPQDPQMFHRSLKDNIRYGKLLSSDKSVIEAAKQAHAHEFIKKLENGYDTLVGERGTKLSGGQKQRVAIARAILKDAPILILDEATSALDSESESLIQDALWELMKGRTAIVIAHRLSTIQKMDRIIVLDEGKIVEQGTHTELIKNKNGLYARLWKHQSGGFLQDEAV